MAYLMRGSLGPEVRTLQQALNENLYPNPRLDVDGIFGRKTEAAVIVFQRQASILVDGIAGPQTKAALGMSITGQSYTHRIRLHFRSLTLTDVPFNQILASTQEVHMPSSANLMYSVDIQRRTPTLTPAQVERIKSSPLCRRI